MCQTCQHHGTVWKEGVEYRAKCVCGWAAQRLTASAEQAWGEYTMHRATGTGMDAFRIDNGAF